MTKNEIFFDRDRINKVCLMLKYMSLTVPLERIDSLKKSVSCKTASEILHTILMDSVWMSEEDGNKETPFVSGLIKCKFDYDWNQLFNDLTEAFSVLKEKEEISLYESNYTGGYYGEVYQACSTYAYAENKKKTTKSCLLINTSNNYTSQFIFSMALLIASIFALRFLENIAIFLCGGLFSVFLLVLIPVMHKNKRNKIKKEIEKNSYSYIIEGKIYELEMPSQKEYYEIKTIGNSFTILCNHFSVDRYGSAFVIRDHSSISEPNSKIYIDKNVQETIRIYYDQITDLKTGKILHPAELKQFLYEENEMGKKENDRVTSGQVQVPQSPEMVLIKEDYHPIKCIIEEVKKRSKIFTRKSDSCR